MGESVTIQLPCPPAVVVRFCPSKDNEDPDLGTVQIVINSAPTANEINNIGSSYELGSIEFEVVGGEDDSTTLVLSDVSMGEGDAAKIDNVSVQNDSITVTAP
jgi:hypothetical protein